MRDIDSLNEWSSFSEGDLSTGRPQWFKLWCEKYAVALGIADLDNDLTQKEKEELFKDVGKVFINSLSYFLQHDAEKYNMYPLSTRDGKRLWNALKRDIDQSYRDYDKRVINGAKGGRPKKNQDSYQDPFD